MNPQPSTRQWQNNFTTTYRYLITLFVAYIVGEDSAHRIAVVGLGDRSEQGHIYSFLNFRFHLVFKFLSLQRVKLLLMH